MLSNRLWDYNYLKATNTHYLVAFFILNCLTMKRKFSPKIKAVNTLKMSESGKLTLNGSLISPTELLIIVNLMASVCDDKSIGTDKVEFLNAWIDNHQNPCK